MGSLRSLRRKEVEPVIMRPPSDMELIQAVQFGTLTHVKTLLALGASPNASDAYSNTALAYAAHLGKLRMVQVLVKNGADVNQKGNLGRAPLAIAVVCPWGPREKICLYLLNHGADVNAVDSDGNTPLMTAVRFKRFDFARHLVERGANPKLRNRDWKRAVDLVGHGKGSQALRKCLKPIS